MINRRVRRPSRLAAIVGALALPAVAGVSLAASHAGAAAKPAARSAPRVRVEPLAHVRPSGYSADVFAHGRYAYLSSWRGATCPADGVRVYDLRNPRRPVRVATFADAASDPLVAGTWTEKTIVQRVRTPRFRGALAVTSFQSCRQGSFQGFGLYDVTNPRRPRKLSLHRTDPRGSHEIWLQARGRRAYVYTAIPNSELLSAPDFDEQRGATTPGRADFRIVDVSDPQRPVDVGEWGAWKELGRYPRGTDADGRQRRSFVHSVITNARATRAYLSYWDLGTVILDITRPARPRYLGRTTTARRVQGNAHSGALGRGGRLLVETHETADGYPSLFDISRPGRPVHLADFRLRATSGPNVPKDSFASGVHDPKVVGTRAYFSWYSRGVVIADIARPRRPRLLAQFVPPAEEDRDGALCKTGNCTLVWGVYAHRGYVLASDMVSGLWVLRVRTVAPRRGA
ncbi:MAG: hypothetical protein M3M94_02350 [Actinomycetota bacterium]|nr:hypothetical protein [Actinomycetota bacterium]